MQVPLYCIKLFDENALRVLIFSPFLGGGEETRNGTVYFGSISWNLSYFHVCTALEGFVVLHKSTLFMGSTRTMLDGSWRFIR